MTIESVKDAANRAKPVTVCMSNGDKWTVPHEDYLFFPPSVAGGVFILVEASGRFHILDASQVVDVSCP